MKTVALFSYPRSGNTWLRYIIEVLTGRPTLGTPDNLLNDPPIWARFAGLPVDPEAEPAALKRHELHHLHAADKQRPLIVVVRNYKECIVRVRNHSAQSMCNFDFARESQLYFSPLAYFDHHGQEKLLLYYEDLIEQPGSVIIQLARFFDVADETYAGFLAHYKQHRERSVRAYAPTSSGSHTLGEKTIYHSLSLTTTERRAWDRCINALGPALYDRYLSRYVEQDEKAGDADLAGQIISRQG